MNQKGQMYLVIAMVLAAWILAIVFVNSLEILHVEKPSTFFADQVRIEMFDSYSTGVFTGDLNNVLTEMALNFKNDALARNHSLQMCFAGFDQNQNFVLGNFSSAASAYSSTRISSTAIPVNSTVELSKSTLQNDFNVSVCGHTFNLRNNFNIYIELRREESRERIIWTNEV